MSYEATVTSKGQVTIPKAVRDRMGLERGEKVLFRFDESGGVRMVRVPAEPRERLDAVRNRAPPLTASPAELVDRERDEWT